MAPSLQFLVEAKSILLVLDVGETFVFWIFELESLFPEATLLLDMLNNSAPEITGFLTETLPVITSPLLAAAGFGLVVDAVTVGISVMFSLWLASVNLSRKKFAEAAVIAVGAMPILGPLLTQTYFNIERTYEKFMTMKDKILNFPERVMAVPRRLMASWGKVQAAITQLMGLPGALMEKLQGTPGARVAAAAVPPPEPEAAAKPAAPDSEAEPAKSDSKAGPEPEPAKTGGRRRRRPKTRRRVRFTLPGDY
jgi:hypothetical protein